MTKEKYVKMDPTLALWEIIDQFGVKGYIQTLGYVVLVPTSEYERVLSAVKDKPTLERRIKNLIKKEKT